MEAKLDVTEGAELEGSKAWAQDEVLVVALNFGELSREQLAKLGLQRIPKQKFVGKVIPIIDEIPGCVLEMFDEIGVEGSYHRAVLNAMLRAGFKLDKVKDSEHGSRVQMIFEDDMKQYKSRVIIIDYDLDDPHEGTFDEVEVEGAKGAICFSCGQNPKNESKAEDADCIAKVLDDAKVPTNHAGKPLNLVGRMMLFAGKFEPELMVNEVLCPSCKGMGTLDMKTWKPCSLCKGMGAEEWWRERDRERAKAEPMVKEICPCGAASAIYAMGSHGEEGRFRVACRGLGCENSANDSEAEYFKRALDAVNDWNTRIKKAKKAAKKAKPRRKKPLRRSKA